MKTPFYRTYYHRCQKCGRGFPFCICDKEVTPTWDGKLWYPLQKEDGTEAMNTQTLR